MQAGATVVFAFLYGQRGFTMYTERGNDMTLVLFEYVREPVGPDLSRPAPIYRPAFESSEHRR
jgi:hypothetical protein